MLWLFQVNFHGHRNQQVLLPLWPGHWAESSEVAASPPQAIRNVLTASLISSYVLYTPAHAGKIKYPGSCQQLLQTGQLNTQQACKYSVIGYELLKIFNVRITYYTKNQIDLYNEHAIVLNTLMGLFSLLFGLALQRQGKVHPDLPTIQIGQRKSREMVMVRR